MLPGSLIRDLEQNFYKIFLLIYWEVKIVESKKFDVLKFALAGGIYVVLSRIIRKIRT
jgi:hypothetical protein